MLLGRGFVPARLHTTAEPRKASVSKGVVAGQTEGVCFSYMLHLQAQLLARPPCPDPLLSCEHGGFRRGSTESRVWRPVWLHMLVVC